MGLSPEEKAKLEQQKRERAKAMAEESKKRAKEAKLLGLAEGEDFSGERSFTRKIKRYGYVIGAVLAVILLYNVGALSIITDSRPGRAVSTLVRDTLKAIPVILTTKELTRRQGMKP